MAKAWGEAAGEAVKNKLDYIKFNMGDNEMRLVGEILPRYVYWKKLKEYTIPVECLSFDRDKEEFTNIEKDWFNHYFPTKANGDKWYPGWSYVALAIDPKDGKIKLCGLKKKLFEQIQSHAEKHLGDPTDAVKGWKIVFEKKSNGPLPFNIEYTLDQMACEVQPLTEDQIQELKDTPSLDKLIPRMTSTEQKSFIETSWMNVEKEETNVDKDATDSFDDDIPF